MALVRSPARFKMVPAGRRSGKTERAIRTGVMKAVQPKQPPTALYVFAAPTHAQARNIFWHVVKALTPAWALIDTSEVRMELLLYNGATIRVAGLDKPERIEGQPLDWICLDEYASMKERTWYEHVRPALSTVGRPGEAWLIGVPEGRGHYFKLWQMGLADTSGDWGCFHWKSAEIIDASEIEAARRELDPKVFAQEYEGSFQSWQGRAYYSFGRDVHVRERLRELYSPASPLIVALDFNVSPGVAVVGQEIDVKRLRELPHLKDDKHLAKLRESDTVTCWIGEHWVEDNSNTPRMVEWIADEWRNHAGAVRFYGDATGGARKTSQTEGTDWDIARTYTAKAWPNHTNGRSRANFDGVPRSNPTERARVNAVNTRLLNAENQARMLIDAGLVHLAEDLDAVPSRDDGSLDKDADKRLTHISDAAGYYVAERWPVVQHSTSLEAA